MITKEQLKKYANNLMFDMEDSEYETLSKEFQTLLKQMDLIGNIKDIESLEPMTFPFEKENVTLREDGTVNNISIEDALSNCDSVKNREIKVPKVVD
ncbi:MAG: Asp-tRNA(Asn)/Glu-tRNA(Gln) amidotransferase subunit GatC [Bacilli bacterium]|nr:Asp-tRNA(Asn)/Glu-tRNA(Gln) amidotransferase subunit GatC [Bacilli bacterium]MDD4733434.1 Asp-tRNA(Asn)/Glu-tRNA(Gln) amidotransferase subunit GatC [Bacilli bacterium]